MHPQGAISCSATWSPGTVYHCQHTITINPSSNRTARCPSVRRSPGKQLRGSVACTWLPANLPVLNNSRVAHLSPLACNLTPSWCSCFMVPVLRLLLLLLLFYPVVFSVQVAVPHPGQSVSVRRRPVPRCRPAVGQAGVSPADPALHGGRRLWRELHL